jgi:hypothetical protein
LSSQEARDSRRWGAAALGLALRRALDSSATVSDMQQNVGGDGCQPIVEDMGMATSKEVAIWCADQGFGMTSTLRRDRFPKEVPKEFFHGKKTTPKDQRAMVAKFLPPIVATKKIDNGVLQLPSFQSTLCCNILSVNVYNQCGLYAHAKERGSLRHGTKRSRAIEMNDTRKLYLATYGAIDTMDHLIKKCSMKYQSWKYWHAAMLLAKTMAIVIAYDMYKEAAKGNLDSAWKVEKPVEVFQE